MRRSTSRPAGTSPRPERLNESDVTRPLYLTLAVLLAPGGVVSGFAIEGRVGTAFGAVLIGLAVLFAVLAAFCRNAYFTPTGLLRVGWAGRSLISWSVIETIELDQLPTQHEDVGILRLRKNQGRPVTVRIAPERLDAIAARVREACPQAFVDDARAGRVTAPAEGRRDAIRRRERDVRRRAAARHVRMASLWILVGAISAAAALVLVLTGALGDGLESWMTTGVMIVAAAGNLRNARNEFFLRRSFLEA